MSSKKLGIAAAVLVLAGLSMPAIVAQDSSSEAPSSEAPSAEVATEEVAARTTWDGVYTDAQADRGKEVYNQKCGNCHNGGMHGPALNSGKFRTKWDEVTLDGLYYFTRDNMPAGSPRTLTDQQYIDVVAYMLQRNKMPAGETELPADEVALGSVTFLAKQPE